MPRPGRGGAKKEQSKNRRRALSFIGPVLIRHDANRAGLEAPGGHGLKLEYFLLSGIC